MMTPFSSNMMLDLLAGKPMRPLSMNEDVIAHLAAEPVAAKDALPLRLLPGFVRGPLKAWIAARQYEKSLIRVWNVSPHLLNDIGIVLTATARLPQHLVAAPERVIAHVAGIAPEQIVQAEISYPSVDRARTQISETAKSETNAADRAFHLAGAV